MKPTLTENMADLSSAIEALKARTLSLRMAQGRLGLLIAGLEQAREDMESAMERIKKDMEGRRKLKGDK